MLSHESVIAAFQIFGASYVIYCLLSMLTAIVNSWKGVLGIIRDIIDSYIFTVIRIIIRG